VSTPENWELYGQLVRLAKGHYALPSAFTDRLGKLAVAQKIIARWAALDQIYVSQQLVLGHVLGAWMTCYLPEAGTPVRQRLRDLIQPNAVALDLLVDLLGQLAVVKVTDLPAPLPEPVPASVLVYKRSSS